jgi:hypothetical protein
MRHLPACERGDNGFPSSMRAGRPNVASVRLATGAERDRTAPWLRAILRFA